MEEWLELLPNRLRTELPRTGSPLKPRDLVIPPPRQFSVSPTGIWGVVRRFVVRWGRLILFAVGVAAIVLLVRSAGVHAVWTTLWEAAPWLPLIFALELTWVAVEGVGLLVLYGHHIRSIPARTIAAAMLVHFTTMMVLPVGRAGAEVARATMFSAHVGAARATAAASLMQSLTLVANTIVSLLCAWFVLTASGGIELSLLLVINGAATLALGGGMYLVMRHARFGGFLGRKFKKMAHVGPEIDVHYRESRRRHFPAFLFCLAARLVQTLQYGLILLAVVGSFRFVGMFLAQGIHLVGAGLGDIVPNQVGVTEGAYRLFAPVLGLSGEPDKAVSIALLARISTLSVAGLCALVLQGIPGAGRFARRSGSVQDGPFGS